MDNQTNQHESRDEQACKEIEGENWPKFWVMEGTDDQNPLSKLNPFLVEKGVKSISSTLQVKRLLNGTILFECEKISQAKNLQKLNQFANVPVKTSPHRTLNSSKGIIRCRDIYDMSEEEIANELSSEGVSQVKRYTFKRDNQIQKTNTLLLTFKMATPPANIKVGYLRVKVDTFIPSPLRCFKCQKYGHGLQSCRGQSACFKCGEKDHDSDTCDKPICCLNCGGKHMANSKQCPVWIKEYTIQKVKAEQKLSHSEARKRVEANNATKAGPQSYASAAAVQKVSIGTQTDESYLSAEPSTKAAASGTDEVDGTKQVGGLPLTDHPKKSTEGSGSDSDTADPKSAQKIKKSNDEKLETKPGGTTADNKSAPPKQKADHDKKTQSGATSNSKVTAASISSKSAQSPPAVAINRGSHKSKGASLASLKGNAFTVLEKLKDAEEEPSSSQGPKRHRKKKD